MEHHAAAIASFAVSALAFDGGGCGGAFAGRELAPVGKLLVGQSFSACTKVRTASGALVAISTLKAGQQILATDTTTGQDRSEPVAAVLVHHDTDLYDLTV